MSVRRLAVEQPASFAFSKESEKLVKFWMGKYPDARRASAVIPLLWIAQKQEGWVSEPAIRHVAEHLGMPFIRVYEVATFYTQFNLAPVGEHLIQVCGTTPCWLRGAEDLKKTCQSRIGPKGQVSADGKFSWVEVECLGACANAPMVQISNRDGDYYYEDLTAESLGTILDTLARGETPDRGPQSERLSSEPAGKAVTLTDKTLYDGSRARPVTLPGVVRLEPQASTTKRPTDDRSQTEKAKKSTHQDPAPQDKNERKAETKTASNAGKASAKPPKSKPAPKKAANKTPSARKKDDQA